MKEYAPLFHDASDLDEKHYDQERAYGKALFRWKFVALVQGLLLTVSLIANAHYFFQRFWTPWQLQSNLPSRFAQLTRTTPTEIVLYNEFTSLNRTVQDAAWEAEDVQPWNGFIALDEEYTIEQDLPHSQRWPWDSSKGVYIMTASHELHCVRILRVHLNEVDDGVEEQDRTWPYPHLLHCLNVLRDTVMCNADDTPLYTGWLHKNVENGVARAGIGTMKMCRNWDQFLSWSRAHSACYKAVHYHEEGFDEIERYKYCPDGSVHWEVDS